MTEAKPIKLGALESAIRITSTDGRAVETVTTPSMWVIADEYADTLRVSGKHTEPWVMRKFACAVHMQAARAEGLFPAGPIDLDTIAEFLNSCTVKLLPSETVTDTDDEDDADDPTEAALGENLEAASETS